MANLQRAKSWLSRITFAYTLTGSPPTLEWHAWKNAEQFYFGDPCVKTGSDTVERAAADSGQLFGVVQAAGTGDGSTLYPILVADRNTIFKCQCDNSLDGVTEFPFVCDIKVYDTNKWQVDIGNNNEDVLRVLGPATGDDITDTTTYPRAHFYIYRSSWDNLVAAK